MIVIKSFFFNECSIDAVYRHLVWLYIFVHSLEKNSYADTITNTFRKDIKIKKKNLGLYTVKSKSGDKNDFSTYSSKMV